MNNQLPQWSIAFVAQRLNPKIMKTTIKKAMNKVQEAIDLLEKIEGKNEQIDDTKDALGFAYADLEYEHNSI